MPNYKFVFWIGTASVENTQFRSEVLPESCRWIKGQQEIGEGGFRHWQFVVAFKKQVFRKQAARVFPGVHLEPSKSSAANEYVWKEETRVEGTQFELGIKPINPSSKTDWEVVWKHAREGKIESVPARVRVVCYRMLMSIASNHSQPKAMVRECFVFWGRTQTGKSRRAWEEAGYDSYSKDPRTKFWDGYQGQECVVIDEFRGGIDVAHILRWTDRYPVRLEIKGSTVPSCVKKIWITSNVDPRLWYADLDEETLKALLRRFNITHFN